LNEYEKNFKWKFKSGDAVAHKIFGVGLIERRSLRSFWEMDRPVRIIEKEMYTITFSQDESLRAVEVSDLTLVSNIGGEISI
tara:strand:+ start:1065 stop:1310 length:246 start_codon:yes stop_codon:yes gene_type:complete